MGELIIISAIAENNCIGVNGEIPWYIPGDFKHFKEITIGSPCIMGDITYQSLPDNARPLPGRKNIVLTLNMDYVNPDVTIFHDIPEAINYAKTNHEKVFICGGGTIYKLTMKYADKLIITRVHKSFNGDTFFPDINKFEWKMIDESERFHDERSGLDYTFETYERVKQ